MSLRDVLIRPLNDQQLKVFEKIYAILHDDANVDRALDIINERIDQPSFRELLNSVHSGFISHLLYAPQLSDWTSISIDVIHILNELFTENSIAEASILKDELLLTNINNALLSSDLMVHVQTEEIIQFILNISCDNITLSSKFNNILTSLVAQMEPSNQNRFIASTAVMNIIQPDNARGQVIFLKARGIEKAVVMLNSSDDNEVLLGAKLLYQLLIQPDERARTIFVKSLFSQSTFLTTLTQLMSRANGELAELLMAITYGISLVRGNEKKFLESGLIYELFEFFDYPFNNRTTDSSFAWAINTLFSCMYEQSLYPHMKMVGLCEKLVNLLSNHTNFDLQITSSVIGIIRYLISYEPIQIELVVVNVIDVLKQVLNDTRLDNQIKQIIKQILQILDSERNQTMLKEMKETMQKPTRLSKLNETDRLLIAAKQAQTQQHEEEENETLEENFEDSHEPKTSGFTPQKVSSTNTERKSFIGARQPKLPVLNKPTTGLKKSNRLSVSELKKLLDAQCPNDEQMKILSEFNLKKAKRFHIIQEMYTTEKNIFIYPFMKENLPDDMPKLFSNFAEVYEIHDKFFKLLSERWLSQKEEVFISVADIFIEFFSWKELYDAYAIYLVEADDGIQFDFSDKPAHIKQQISKWAGECLILANFLILPVQPTPPVEEYDYLKQALDDIRALTVKLNAAKKVIQDKRFLDHYNTKKSKAIYQCVLMSDGFYALIQSKDKKTFNIKFLGEEGKAVLREGKKKKIKDVTDIINIAIPEGKKEKVISLLFGFGSDFEGWSSTINSVFKK
ncbi:Rho/RAC guanine nucleotide exchange factor [Entamoeba marina]